MTTTRYVKPTRSSHWPITADRWNPWRTLVEDYPELTVTCSLKLPEGTMGLQLGKRIWIDRDLGGVDRTDTLAHELIHYQRRIFPKDPVERLAEERVVEELTARRLIPFDDFCRVLLHSPNSDLSWWAWHLRVGLPTLEARLITLSPVERAALQQVRGGALPTPAGDTYWDKRCAPELPAVSQEAAAR
jgi:hypothetical protein